MMKKLIGWVCLGICLTACEEEETNYTGESGKYSFSISLSLATDVRLQTETDYVPMATKAEDEIKTIIDENLQYMVLKKIDSEWYVDSYGGFIPGKISPISTKKKIYGNESIGTIDLTLTPGDYNLLVVANGSQVVWNPDLKPGYKVSKQTEQGKEIAYAFTYYYIPTSSSFFNKGYPQLSYEIFTDSYPFTVTKTGDLHTDPLSKKRHPILSRKVSRFRLILKDVRFSTEKICFDNTEHFADLELIAKDNNRPFCDGIDCLGNAYYKQEPTTKFRMFMSTYSKWQDSGGSGYQLVLRTHSTYTGVFILTDEKNVTGIPYDICLKGITGQSGGFTYYYNELITGHTLYPNSIDGVVFQPTNVSESVPGTKGNVKLEQVPNENAVDLFGPFYEVNQP